MSEAAEERSRRTLLSGLAGGAVALAATSFGPAVVSATHQPEDVENGVDNPFKTHRTLVANNRSPNTPNDYEVDALFGLAQTNGAGVAGQSTGGVGVKGYSGPIPMPDTLGQRVGVYGSAPMDGGNGVEGHGYVGVRGFGLSGSSFQQGYGVRGEGSYGVRGDGELVGVYGQSSTGTGVRAIAIQSTGYALNTLGRLKLEGASGVATIPANRKSVATLVGVDLDAAAFALLSANANIGRRALWYTFDLPNNTLIVNISSVYSTTKALKVSYLLLTT